MEFIPGGEFSAQTNLLAAFFSQVLGGGKTLPLFHDPKIKEGHGTFHDNQPREKS